MNQTYTVKWCEVKTTSTGKSYLKATIEGVDGQVSIWSDFPNFANIAPGSTIVGELKKNDKGYLNLYPPKAERSGAYTKNGGSYQAKAKADLEVQQVISENVARAQDRTAWMWAKNNASQLLAAQDLHGFKYSSPDSLLEAVLTLATKIYNGEPSEPFTSPKKKEDAPDITEDEYNSYGN